MFGSGLHAGFHAWARWGLRGSVRGTVGNTTDYSALHGQTDQKNTKVRLWQDAVDYPFRSPSEMRIEMRIDRDTL